MGEKIQINDRTIGRALIIIALGGLVIGLAAMIAGRSGLARWAWITATTPVIAALAFAIIRDLRAGRVGVDLLALLSMAAALVLDQTLAGAIVAVMYAGGQALEDFAVGRAERDLRALIDRAPRLAHRKHGDALEDVPIDQIDVGNIVLVRAGEVVPIDGHVASPSALIDESMLTGEPIPVTRQAGQAVSSGTINVGDTFEMRAIATAGDSAYAGIVRMVTAAQTAKAPFIRMADRYALLLLPVTLCIAGAAWWLSGDAVRALAVLVAATPCPLILAAPAAFIGGASQAARRGILVKGSGPLEALARIHTVMFDKTGTLTVGGARLVAIETAPGVVSDEALRAQAIYERSQRLLKRRAIAGSTLQLSQKTLERARAEVADAETPAASAKAALAVAKSNLEHTSIVAPIAGLVVARNVMAGEAVVAGLTEPLFRVAADPRMVKINVTVGSRLADALRVGDAVSVSLETDLDHPFAGRVTQISVGPKSSAGAATYDVVIATVDADIRLKPDTTTRIRIMLGGAHLPTKN